ncbi:Odorant receptor 50 [Operophtera brumata]|uniref:Odorant receptor n=1 Tax=Operophtera brumata TaxID=104452 RepID=A0A0L7K4E6_OPEBR|nr:Odorant receptor 50 [Operophtera brumata]
MSPGTSIIFYIITIACATSYYYSYLVSMLWFLFVRSPQTGDLLAAMVVMSLGVVSEIGTLKLIFMFTRVKQIRRIVDEYLQCDTLTVSGSRFSRNLMMTLRNVKKRAMLFWILLMVNGIVYIIYPAFLSGRHLIEDMYVIYGLEPMLETPNYEIAMLLMGASVCFICFSSANITAFIIIIVGYTEAQMLSLSHELVNIWDDAIHQNFMNGTEVKIELISALFQKSNVVFDDEVKRNINTEVKKRLVQIIQKHARNIHLLRQVEDVFRVPIAVGFVFLIVGCIAALLGGLENTFLEIPFALSQVAMDCWTGQRLIDASVTYEKAVYDCKWENFNRHNMKIVLVMLQNSQRTLTLSAGGMTMLSFSCLMSILRSIYSANTTLRSTMKKPD